MPSSSSASSGLSLKNVAMLSVVLFSLMSFFLFVQHELHQQKREALGFDTTYKRFRKTVSEDFKLLRKTMSKDLEIIKDTATKEYQLIRDTATTILHIPSKQHSQHGTGGKDDTPGVDDDRKHDDDIREDDDDVIQEPGDEHEPRYFTAALESIRGAIGDLQSGLSSATAALLHPEQQEGAGVGAVISGGMFTSSNSSTSFGTVVTSTAGVNVQGELTSTKLTAAISATMKPGDLEKRGVMICNGKQVDSEVIYWKIVPGDAHYESPITPHHGLHHDRYLSFEYDQGGWNNIRMSLECLIVVAHAMGRTLVIPPQQHLYLLGKIHQDKHDSKAHDEMGFEDFFDIDLLRSHRGFHVLHMEKFLALEGVTGGLKGKLPPGNRTNAWGAKLWKYLKDVADGKPTWMGQFVVFPDHPGNFTNMNYLTAHAKQRLEKFMGGRQHVFYDDELQRAHHIHFPADGEHRILQHHYAFAFFANPEMQSFYRRFVRDYMRYRDEIQCAGAELIAQLRADSLREDPTQGGSYYALHIRRGDFQYKDVKHSAAEILRNLCFQNGTAIIPPGSVVYLSTDDPKGICENCFVNRQPCTSYASGSKPVGCMEDTSWDAFRRFGWKLRFLDDYLRKGHLKGANPNSHGMVESIVCTRAKAFAGTYYSTFTGYIHRLRGYHGLGESTYYHTTGKVFHPQMGKSVGNGFSREWRAGWTDDAGGLI